MTAESQTETIVAAIENPQYSAMIVETTTTNDPGVPAGFSNEEWKATLQRVAAGLESGICESCES
jgi:hypothetical protein